jgi:hypothetical protein
MPFLLKCYEASILSSEKVDRSLSFVEWINWSTHMVVCPTCMLFQRQIALLHRISMDSFVVF